MSLDDEDQIVPVADNFNTNFSLAAELLDKDEETQDDAQPRESEDAASDEQELIQEDSDRETVIAAPDSWPEETREKFSRLPRDMQAFIAGREAEQKSVFNRHVNEAVEAKKAADTIRQSLADTLNTYLANAVNFDPVITEGLKTDWAKLAQDDPIEYVAKKAAFDQRAGELQRAEQTRLAIAQQQYAEVREREQQSLLAKAPDWAKDRDLYAKDWKRMAEYATTMYGYSDQEIEQISDHRSIMVLRDAGRYQDMLAAGKSLPAKKVPFPAGKVQSPGGAKGSGANKAILQQVARTSDLRSKAELLANLI